MKKLLKKIKNVFVPELTSEKLIAQLRKKGAKIGESVVFTAPKDVRIDSTFPYCVEIGNDVTIAAGVRILAHDYSYSVLNQVYGIMPQNSYVTKIGNNVFLGQGSILLMGTNIGDNVIIGAGAVVHGKIPSNTVWAGNPARQICTLEEFKQKREQRYEEGAVNLARQYYKVFGKKPDYKDMKMYIGLFAPRTEEFRHYFEELNSRFPNVAQNVWNMEQKYEDLDAFLRENDII